MRLRMAAARSLAASLALAGIVRVLGGPKAVTRLADLLSGGDGDA